MNAIQPPLSNAQLELLDLFSLQLPDDTLLELKQLLLQFKFDQLDKLADQEWAAKGMTEQTITERLNSHHRTPYTSQTRHLQQQRDKA
ncbi:hypothetical protein [Spirosoma spitsbergense]|jgi:hypothetical protein|uniref:hypothetical protein n=1 Tax=Spirosoma spitsbergense TaxID=431554 RepID=UPI00035D29F7|nr:hypothetical protein [Spirosoma spitsbergense]